MHPKTYTGRRGFSLIELLTVLVIVMVIASMAIPKVITTIQTLRTSGDMQSLNSAILLAKMTAAANFARARVHADLTGNTFWVEYQPSGSSSWTTSGGTQNLSKNVSFGYGTLASAPANTQSSFGQAPTCSGAANTACVTFNSRGIPVDSSNSPTGNDALYVTDGKTVTGVTVSATGLTKVWRTEATSANWTQR